MAAGQHRFPSILLSGLLLAAGLALATAAPAAQHHPRTQATSKHARPHLTLEQAVARVQNETGGKVLKADSRNTGRTVEYRIKVLTPDGHVRVVTLRSDQRNEDTN